MTALTTIRTAQPADVLAAIGYRLGFAPAESLVMVTLSESGRMGLVARVDLADLAQAAPGMVNAVRREGPARVLVVTYSVDPIAAEQAHVIAGAWLDPFDVEALCVEPHGYRVRHSDPTTCRPLSDLDDSPVAALYTAAGMVVAQSRDALLPPLASTFTRRRVDQAADATTPLDPAEAIRAWIEYAANPVSDLATIAALAKTLTDKYTRDGVLLLATGASPEVATITAQRGETPEVSAALAQVTTGNEPPSAQAAAWARAIGQIASHVQASQYAAPAWTLWAVTQWWADGTARANDALDIALAADPTYRLALLFQQICETGLAPGWARR